MRQIVTKSNTCTACLTWCTGTARSAVSIDTRSSVLTHSPSRRTLIDIDLAPLTRELWRARAAEAIEGVRARGVVETGTGGTLVLLLEMKHSRLGDVIRGLERGPVGQLQSEGRLPWGKLASLDTILK